MSIKHGMLALLRDGPSYGYQLRAAFEESTGSAWPVNIGQVYTTLGRLERDGLVAKCGEDAQGHVFYEVTAAGVVELDAWFARPITAADRPKDELAMKLALAVTVPGVDVPGLIQAQRAHAQERLGELTRRKLRAVAAHPAQSLVLEAQLFQTEAEIRWLDYVEGQICQ